MTGTRSSSNRWGSPLPWLAGLLAVYLLVPLLAFVVRFAHTSPQHLSAPGTGGALLVSVETASIATGLIALLGVPLAYLLARGRSRRSTALGLFLQLPIALPPLMSGVLLLYLVGPYGAVGRLFGGRLTDDEIGIVLAQVFVSAPFLIVAARAAFAAVDPALDEVAATLGHRSWSRFLRVAVPAAAPGIGAGLALSWLRAFGEFGATVVLAYHPYSLPVFTYVQFGGSGLSATELPVAAALVAALLVGALAVGVPRLRRRRVAVRLPAPRAPAPRSRAELSFRLAFRAGDFRLSVQHRCRASRLALIGPSGAGKTLTLRLLAGLADDPGGSVRLGGRELRGLGPEHRPIGYLPQDSALLPGLPVWRQVTLGVGVDPAVAAGWLRRLHIAELADRRPEQLSGGQRRRVALARALSREPALLLLDEPFAGLDVPVRGELARELRALQRDTGLTTVLVSHDPAEAAMLADDVVVLDRGQVLQAGAVADVYARPRDVQVARLLGLRNIGVGWVAESGWLSIGGARLPARTAGLPAGTPVTWCIPPPQVRLAPAGSLPATVLDVVELGGERELELALVEGDTISARAAGAAAFRPGDRVRIDLPADGLTLWPAADFARLPVPDEAPISEKAGVSPGVSR